MFNLSKAEEKKMLKVQALLAQAEAIYEGLRTSNLTVRYESNANLLTSSLSHATSIVSDYAAEILKK